ncbi:MAG TPA: hypothetical protein VJ792_01675 [Candidatus Nitrosotalea sp.]|nr:hypothetical protein [Candidatus Nitrosotalea sp.]
MIFENPKYNSIFIISFSIFTFGINQYLKSIQSLNLSNPGPPPEILLDLPTIVYSIFGVYIGVCLTMLIYNSLLQGRPNRERNNLISYGIVAFATLVMIFVDLVSVMAMEHDTTCRIFQTCAQLSEWQQNFVLYGFPALGILVTWGLRYPKVQYEVKQY